MSLNCNYQYTLLPVSGLIQKNKDPMKAQNKTKQTKLRYRRKIKQKRNSAARGRRMKKKRRVIHMLTHVAEGETLHKEMSTEQPKLLDEEFEIVLSWR